MTDDINLDVYFARIGYAGAREPTLETLRALHFLHPQALAFENLNPFLGLPVLLDAASLTRKLLEGGRGGYCYEQNGLLFRVLRQFGFKVSGLSARVLLGRAGRAVGRSHMLLRIDLNDDIWIADVGFGTQTLTAPLRLHENGVQDTPHGAFQLEAMGPEFNQQSNWSGAWETHYSFTLDEQILDDYEASNWYRATHPQSPFVNNLMCARPLGLQRFGLLNDVFTVRNADGSEPKRRILRDPDELMDVLEDSFGLTLPAPRADLATKLARVFGHEHSLK